MKKYLNLFLVFVSSYAFSGSYCLPNQSCWPSPSQWAQLNRAVDGRLHKIDSPLKSCKQNINTKLCQKSLSILQNPFSIENSPWATQVTGLLHGWRNVASEYVVIAKNSKDITAAVNFARKHRIKLVIKGTGHDYLGRSNAPNSLLIWTHQMRKMTLHSNFIPKGSASSKGHHAVTVEAGTRWIDVYEKVSVKHHRYVQGGGCTTVGAAGGFSQGGGFGSYSKQFGTGSASILEAEIVTANGKILVANAYQNQDLFWAIKGGGAGTFGVVSKMTFLTHPLPKQLGILKGTLKANNNSAFKELIYQFLIFYKQHLNNSHWGEQVAFHSDNTIELSMSFINLNQQEVDKLWQSFAAKLNQSPYKFTANFKSITIPGHLFWSAEYRKRVLPQSIKMGMGMKPCNDFWWQGNDEEVSIYIYNYFSRYIPFYVLNKTHIRRFADTLYQASRLSNNVVLHFNKGQYGASPEVLRRLNDTSMNPKVSDAIGLLIIAGGEKAIPHLKEFKPDYKRGQHAMQHDQAAFDLIAKITPNAGTYVNEANYFETNWQASFWGINYPKLLSIKNKYDPTHLFSCHHCVGSEN